MCRNSEHDQQLPLKEAQRGGQSVSARALPPGGALGGLGGGVSSLEMAMYVLLAIFGAAVVVFAANCVLYAARRRRSGKWRQAFTFFSEELGPHSQTIPLIF